MSSRTTLRPTVVIDAGSMAGNLTSLPTVLQGITGVSYGLSWSGTAPVGTASIQLSNDYSLNPNGTVDNPGTWTTATLDINGTPGTTIPITGTPGTYMIDPIKTDAYAIRLIYTAGSGTGSLTATINGKVS